MHSEKVKSSKVDLLPCLVVVARSTSIYLRSSSSEGGASLLLHHEKNIK